LRYLRRTIALVDSTNNLALLIERIEQWRSDSHDDIARYPSRIRNVPLLLPPEWVANIHRKGSN
jgi:hypothetical protein